MFLSINEEIQEKDLSMRFLLAVNLSLLLVRAPMWSKVSWQAYLFVCNDVTNSWLDDKLPLARLKVFE